MNEFQLIIKDILVAYKSKLSYNLQSTVRAEILKNMQNELVIMKQTYELLRGPQDVTFEQILNAIN